MEVCGGHTHAIYRFGLKDLLPPNIELIHGPGCPVCVLPMGRIDDGLVDGRGSGRDLHRVRRHDARSGNARAARSSTKLAGMDVRIVYSPADALKLAQNNPEQARDVLRHWI